MPFEKQLLAFTSSVIYTNTSKTLNQLIKAAQEAWFNIDDGILYRLATKMPKRVKSVINADEWYTKY